MYAQIEGTIPRGQILCLLRGARRPQGIANGNFEVELPRDREFTSRLSAKCDF